MRVHLKETSLLSGLLVGSCLLLSGCASWTGLIPEKYDGNAIEADEAAIAAYNDHKEVIGAGKELFILEPFSEDLLRPSFSLTEKRFVGIDSDEYTVGEDLPEGRYQFRYVSELMEPHLMNNATLRVTDETGNLVFEELLTPFETSFLEMDLYEGNKLVLMGEDISVEIGASESRFVEEETALSLSKMDVLLTNGVWEVGEHLEAGTYIIPELPLSGYLYVFDDTTEPRVFELGGIAEFSEETGEMVSVESEKELSLEENQKIYLKDLSQPLELRYKENE